MTSDPNRMKLSACVNHSPRKSIESTANLTRFIVRGLRRVTFVANLKTSYLIQFNHDNKQ